MSDQRVPLFERLPEIYRLRDEEQVPRGQLKHFLAVIEGVFGELHRNIETLYHDLFIETCDEWVIAYLADLLGVSHLSGDPWTLRADVADTIALRRRKGTLAGLERSVFNLTRWGVHCVELRENLVWSQHLNHQRPDQGGVPPYSLPSVTRFTPVRGGTVVLRDPAMLSLLGTPFDPFAHVADLRPPTFGGIRYNLPNLAVFLWRLEDYRVPLSRPLARGVREEGGAVAGRATHLVRFDVDPLGRPAALFNTYQFNPDRQPPVVTQVDQTPGPIPTARLTQESKAGRPEEYLAVDTYDTEAAAAATRDLADVGLQLHLPRAAFAGEDWPNGGAWRIRGANLLRWDKSLPVAVQNREIVVDPVIGRLVIGVASPEEAEALERNLLLTYTYAAPGPVGAHPVTRFPTPEPWQDRSVIAVSHFGDAPLSLNEAFEQIDEASGPTLIEIRDSLIHVLDLAHLTGTVVEDGGPNLLLRHPLCLRAASGERPIITLGQPLRFRPRQVAAAGRLTVRLEGVYVTRGASFPGGEALIARAAVNRLEIIHCTLDPGGHRILDRFPESERAPIHDSLLLREPYGFSDYGEENAFDQTPEVIIQRSITGPLLLDTGYRLTLTESLVDGGQGPADRHSAPYHTGDSQRFPVSAAGDPQNGWGPPTRVNAVTIFGGMRVASLAGKGGIWAQSLQVWNNQLGCLKFCCFCGRGDRLPPHHACVHADEARLRFVSEIFGQPGYGQLAHHSDFRIRERGPRDEAMGAFGFLMEAHKWRNLQIRFREFMPVGVRPLLIPVT